MGHPNLILITIDCLRADHVGWHGYVRPTTPFLDQLAARSVIFENAIAAGVPTYFSFPAIHAGRYPLARGRDFIGLAPGEPTLAGALRDAGYQTAAFVAGNPYVGRWSGYAQGFKIFDDGLASSAHTLESPSVPSNALNQRLREFAARLPGGRPVYDELYFRYGVGKRARHYRRAGWATWRRFPSATALTQRARDWLAKEARAPFFLWLHYMDAHRPYFPSPESLRALGLSNSAPQHAFEHYNFWIRGDLSDARRARALETERALYDASIRDIDTQVARLATVHQEREFAETLLAITSDHGEAFLERGERDHDPMMLHRALTHVPLLLCANDLQPRRETSVFGLIDLAPTLLEFARVAPPPTFQGASRTHNLKNAETWDAIALTEVLAGRTHVQVRGRALHGGSRLVNAQNEHRKLVADLGCGETALYDWRTDPNEAHPLPFSDHRADAAPLFRALHVHLTRQRARPYTRVELDLRLEWLCTELAARAAGKGA